MDRIPNDGSEHTWLAKGKKTSFHQAKGSGRACDLRVRKSLRAFVKVKKTHHNGLSAAMRVKKKKKESRRPLQKMVGLVDGHTNA